MANNKIYVKRSSVSGRQPNTTTPANTQYINAGELALNMPDKILYTSDGTNLIPIGANNANVNITNTLTVNNIVATSISGPVLISNAANYVVNTNIGSTLGAGFSGVVYPANTQWWANLAIGTHYMIGPSSNGTPDYGDFGYFHKIMNRDNSGGWGGIWLDYDGTAAYWGSTTVSTSYATWNQLITTTNGTTSLTGNLSVSNTISVIGTMSANPINTAGIVGQGFANFAGIGGNYLVLGQANSASMYGCWQQAGSNNANGPYYPIYLNPLGGNVAIGTMTTPTTALVVNGTITVSNLNSAAIGLYSYSNNNNGVLGTSNSASGIYGVSNSGPATVGYSVSGVGINGISLTSTGVWGQSNNSTGIIGQSLYSGNGVWAQSNTGWPMGWGNNSTTFGFCDSSGAIHIGLTASNVVINSSAISISGGNAVINSTAFSIGGLVIGGVSNNNNKFNTTGTAAQVIDSIVMGTNFSAQYLIAVKDNVANNRYSSNLLMTHDTVSAYLTEWAQITTNSSIGVFSATSNATSAILNFTPISTNTSVSFVRSVT